MKTRPALGPRVLIVLASITPVTSSSKNNVLVILTSQIMQRCMMSPRAHIIYRGEQHTLYQQFSKLLYMLLCMLLRTYVHVHVCSYVAMYVG